MPSRAAATPARNALELALLLGLLGALAWLPVWLGSSRLPAWGVNAMLFPGLAAFYEILVITSRTGHAVGVSRLRLPAILYGAVAIFVGLQAATWTPASLHHPIWGMAAEALEAPLHGSISVDRDLTQLALLRLLTAAATFWLALQLCRNPSRADWLLKGVALICTAYALVGLADFSFSTERPNEPVFVQATFANRNSFATYAGIGLVCCFGLFWRQMEERAEPSGSIRGEVVAAMEALSGRGAVWLAFSLVLVIALLLSASRGAILAALCGLTSLLVVRPKGRGRSQVSSTLGAIAVPILMLIPLAIMFGGIFVGKVEAVGGFYDPGRLASYRITLGSILDSPFLGYGFGTFVDIFPMFRDRTISVWGIWDRADNSYLETFQGLGLIFGSCLVACVALLLARCFRGAMMRRKDSSFPRIAMSAGLLVGVHALTDFSLQVQAVELTFYALLGMGVAQSASSREVIGD